uniref:Rod shape-determining protein MreD n=1 Tax=Clostridioides difficile TaxID=1496 RepID=A0A381I899_CLODI|nr:rod shape-determining protein MreD [Clostridioides difficile]
MSVGDCAYDYRNSITNYIDIFGISFNLVLIYVTIISLYLDELEGGIIAVIIGLIKDITLVEFLV